LEAASFIIYKNVWAKREMHERVREGEGEKKMEKPKRKIRKEYIPCTEEHRLDKSPPRSRRA